jgi:O-antigen ligase
VEPGRPDVLGRALELGLAALVVLAPWPFGGVPPAGRLAIELAALALLTLWCARALVHGVVLPPRAVTVGLALALALAAIQALPLGEAIVSRVSPRAAELRQEVRPPEDVLHAEARILGVEPRSLEPLPPALSVDPVATASALRTGGAAVALLLVALTVGTLGGARRVVLALLFGCALQGFYGMLVLLSGHDRIWHVPKEYNLDAATGTYVNKNHFACLLAMGLACGLGLILARARATTGRTLRDRLVLGLDARGSRTALLGLSFAIAFAGLSTSFSRAGIAAGVLGLALAALGSRIARTPRHVVPLVVVLALAALPLAQIGADRLAAQYADSPEQFASGRVAVWRDTLRMATAFPAVGAGFGSFAAIYPSFRSPDVRRFYDHAHNDPLQVLAEGGILGAAFLALVVGPILACAVRAIARGGRPLAAGIAAALCAYAAHGLVDFNGHIPANLAVATVLAGLLLGEDARG